MALTKGNKIAVSDVTTALGTKIDTAGTGLSKSGTSLALSTLHSENSTIGSSSAQTLAYSGTFTIPYITRDTYGRVSGGGTRTITMPSAPSSVAALSTASVKFQKVSGQTFSLPSGGTWGYYMINNRAGTAYVNSANSQTGTAAGGTNLTQSGGDTMYCFAIKIA